VVKTSNSNDHFRVRCVAFTSGTVTYSFSDGDRVLFELKDQDGNVAQRVTQAGVEIPGTVTVTGSISGPVSPTTVTPVTQEITVAGAVSLDANHVRVTGPASSTYAITLAAPSRAGQTMVIEMVATTATNAVTLALTNVVGGSAATTATFNAADETLVLISAEHAWVVVAEVGVTLA
jgi:hypothetical protein